MVQVLTSGTAPIEAWLTAKKLSGPSFDTKQPAGLPSGHPSVAEEATTTTSYDCAGEKS
jgi:hypothetical protein